MFLVVVNFVCLDVVKGKFSCESFGSLSLRQPAGTVWCLSSFLRRNAVLLLLLLLLFSSFSFFFLPQKY